jgi:hypothetical protein
MINSSIFPFAWFEAAATQNCHGLVSRFTQNKTGAKDGGNKHLPSAVKLNNFYPEA